MASLHYKFATMNSGKSTQLIQAHFNYLERGMHPLAMTPAIDDRFGAGVISARVGLELRVEVFSDSCDLFEMVKARHAERHIDVFIVDEAQFLTKEQVYDLDPADSIALINAIVLLNQDFFTKTVLPALGLAKAVRAQAAN